MKKIIISLLVLFIGFSVSAQNWTQIYGRYGHQSDKFDSLLRPPLLLPQLSSRIPGMFYYNALDSALHWWTGFTDITFTGGGTANLTATQVGYGSGTNLLTGTPEFNYTQADSTIVIPYSIFGKGARKQKSLVTLRVPDTTTWDVLHIPTMQGDTAINGGPEGDFSMGLEQTFINTDGQRDATLYLGYNLAGPGILRNPKDAASSLVFESHFIQGIEQTETYFQMTNTSAVSVRPLAFNVNKLTNATQELHQVSSLTYEDISGTKSWIAGDTSAELRLSGSQAALVLANDNGGGGSITPTADGSGNLLITNGGIGNIIFNRNVIASTPGTAGSSMLTLNGNTGSNQIGINMSTGGGSGSFIPILVSQSNPGGQSNIFANNASGAYNLQDVGANNGPAATYYNDNSIVQGYTTGVDTDRTYKIAYNSQAIFNSGLLFFLDRNGRASFGATPPVASAALAVQSTTGGFLPPVMTTEQKNSISAAEGLQVYDLNLHQPQFFNGIGWIGPGTTVISNGFSQVGTATTTFTVSIGSTLANTTYKVNLTPTSLLSAAPYYVTNKTTTTFDVTYSSSLTGTVTFDWSIFP